MQLLEVGRLLPSGCARVRACIFLSMYRVGVEVAPVWCVVSGEGICVSCPGSFVVFMFFSRIGGLAGGGVAQLLCFLVWGVCTPYRSSPGGAVLVLFNG
jgi:hypothetical protein